MAHFDGDVLNSDLVILIGVPCTCKALILSIYTSKVFDVKFPIAIIPYESMSSTTVSCFHQCSLSTEKPFCPLKSSSLLPRWGVMSTGSWQESSRGLWLWQRVGNSLIKVLPVKLFTPNLWDLLGGENRLLVDGGRAKEKYMLESTGLMFKSIFSFSLVRFFSQKKSCRGAYLCMRYDAKARVETNEFERHYGCTNICESCCAQNPVYRHDPEMSYQDFRPDSARHLTTIDHGTYMRTCANVSPWHQVPGWKLETCLHDIMHVVFLGTARDLVGSLLADFLEYGVLGDAGESVNTKLRKFSLDMHKAFKTERKLGFCRFCK